MQRTEDYGAFIARKSQLAGMYGFAPIAITDALYPFQQHLVEWALRKGRAAIFADCGLGKTPMQLVWADNVVKHTGRPVLVVTPLAVSYQVLREAEKFGVECCRVVDGAVPQWASIIVTNYERLRLFSADDFSGIVCDESSILKSFDGATKSVVTEFAHKLKYRLLCTATAAPNDYIELGTSAEALGELGYMDMLQRFFKNEQHSLNPNRNYAERGKWRFKRHAEQPFWRWVCSWARACRRPSDIGFDDAAFVLPPIAERQHVVAARTLRDGWLFEIPANCLQEEREDRRRTIEERCELVAKLVDHGDKAIVWCHLNDEGDRLERLIAGAKQVKGSDSDDEKEETLLAFATGDLRVLVTKPKIGAFGLNLQRCAHVVTFPSHSYEQYYQSIRRCWRFGQTRPVTVDIVATEGEANIIANLQRKSNQAAAMFESLVAHMKNEMSIARRNDNFSAKEEIPTWLSPTK